MSETAECRAAIARGLTAELSWRFPDADAQMREALEATSTLAANVLAADIEMRKFGGQQAAVRQHISMTESLLIGLHLLGPEQVAGTYAETILTDALQTRLAILEQTPVAGYA